MKHKNSLCKLLCMSTLSASIILFGGVVKAEECTPNQRLKTLIPGTLTVTSVIIPPFISKEGQKFSGIDVNVIDQFAQDNCLKVDHVITDSAAAIQYVVSGRSDISVGAWYRTKKRASVLGVSDPVYMEQTAIYSSDGADKFEQLIGKKVGSVQGYQWVEELKALYGGDLKLYPTAVALAQDISTGRIDAAINTYSVGVAAQASGGLSKALKIKIVMPDPRVKSSVYPAQSSFLYTKGNVGLGDALNKTIRQMKSDGSLAAVLQANGLDASAAETGTPRFSDEE